MLSYHNTTILNTTFNYFMNNHISPYVITVSCLNPSCSPLTDHQVIKVDGIKITAPYSNRTYAANSVFRILGYERRALFYLSNSLIYDIEKQGESSTPAFGFSAQLFNSEMWV